MSHKIVIDELNNVVQITAPGPQGVQGPAGTTLRYGAGAPTSGDGNNGDFWVDTTNERLYGPKAAGTWPAGYTSLIGPANTLTIGTVTTGPTNGTAAASITGTSPNQVLDLTLPAGPTGPAVNLGSAVALPLAASALSGTATAASREDHVHSSTGVTVTLLQAYVKNDSGVALNKGAAVYISGANGTNVLITKADANSDPSSSKTLGLLSQDLAINELGYVTTEGLVAGINTSSATAGQSVWLSTTAGEWVFGSPPAEPAHSVYLGVVARANASNGEILVKVQNGYELDELHDVFAGSPSNGHLLRYDASSTAWVNGQALGTSIAAAAIGGTHIAVGAVGSTQIASTAVIASKIGSEASGSGNVLIANGAGGASWGVSVNPDIGTFTSSTVTYSFGTPNDFSQTYVATSSTANQHALGVGGGGSVILIGGISSSAANSKTWNTYNFATSRVANTAGTAFATASIAPSPAGTIQSSGIHGLDAQEAASTAVYWTEKWLTSAGATAYASIRKYNTALSTAIWNAVVFGPSSITNWTSLNNTYLTAKYAATPTAWFGALWNIDSASSTAQVWAVNDTSGSVFKADFGVNASGTRWEILDVAYIPPVTGDGTVWAIGRNYSTATTVRRVAYTLNSGALTAASTAENWTPIGTTAVPDGLYWDSVATAIVWRSGETYYGIDRTFGTNTFTSTGAQTVRANVRYGNYGFGIRSISDTSSSGAEMGVFGTAGTLYAPAQVQPLATNSPRPILVGGTLVGFVEGYDASATSVSYLLTSRRNDQEVVIAPQAYGRLIVDVGTTPSLTVNRTIADDRITFATGMTYLPANGSVVHGVTGGTAVTGDVTRVIRSIQMK